MKFVLYTLAFFSLLILSPTGYSQDIATVNISEYLGNDRFRWAIYLQSSPDVLKQIKYVQYTLHPTFPNPVRKVSDFYTSFRLETTGWGEFDIYVTIVYKNGNTKELRHSLKLGKGIKSIQNSPNRNYTIKASNVAKRTSNNSWEWTVFLKEVDSQTLSQIKCVEYTLHPTFNDPIQLICEKGDNENMHFPLTATGWGTFRVGIKVIFKDNTTKSLFRDLVF